MNESGYLMVPTARLELARPKSLPPQDSVSTNSTTSAKGHAPEWILLIYCGMSAAFEPAFWPGIGAGAAGCVCAGTAVRSSTLAGFCCCSPK